jgi:hypothetical protein
MAAGSHQTLAGWESRVCVHCGNKIVIARQGAVFHRGLTTDGPWSEHFSCKYDGAYRDDEREL